jgi:1-acyl-sn-glycerol-3-phosphate acyltransferase
MNHLFAFICPVCASEDSIIASKCSQCGSRIKISAAGIQTPKGEWTLDDYLSWMKKTIKVRQGDSVLQDRTHAIQLSLENPVWRISQEAILRQGQEKFSFQSFAGLFRRSLLLPIALQKGFLVICEEYFCFCSHKGNFVFSINDLTCVTTNGHYFEFKVRGHSFFQIHFLHESPLKYEIIFQNWLIDYFRSKNKIIVEFQPKFRFTLPPVPQESLNITPQNKLAPNIIQKVLRGIVMLKLQITLRLWIRINVMDRQFLPKSYPYIMLLNHQSSFDPFIILTFLDQDVGFLTKSTSFSNILTRMFLKLGKAIPTTRFETDPSVIRHIQKYLESGIPVGIFPEGERCWDGQMHSFKYSVIRLLLKMRIPVVPVIIHGGFAFMPRWDHIPHRRKVTVQVRAPFSLITGRNNIDDIKQWLEQQFLEIQN